MSGPNDDNTATVLPTHLHEGTRVGGRYRIDGLLGGGGMASVYRATHEVLQQPVAIKVVSPQIREVPGIAERFVREARAATQLKSEHVARVFDVGITDDGAPFMVMEYLEGSDLGAIVDSRGPLPIEDAIDWVLQACEALAEVHGVGIVHRDLKPANLFLTRGADGLACVKLIDFGISRFATPPVGSDAARLTHPEAIMGSPHYMAPEQMEAASKAGVRSDIWGIGAVLYELLSAESPYEGDSYRDLYVAAMSAPPEPPSVHRNEIPSGLDAVVLRCLKTDPEERFADVAELAAALAPFGGDAAGDRADNVTRTLAEALHRSAREEESGALSTPGASRTTSRVRRRSVSRRRRRRASAIFALVAMAAIAGAASRSTVRARVMSFAMRATSEQAVPAPAIAEQAITITNATVEPAPVPPPVTVPAPSAPVATVAPAPSAATPIAVQTNVAPPAPTPEAWHPRPPQVNAPSTETASATETASEPLPSDKLFEDRK